MQFQADRFRDLIRAVENAPDDRFDMDTFGYEGPCGTVACACGWYAISKPEVFSVNLEDSGIYRVSDGGGMYVKSWADHFVITDEDARQLFYDTGGIDNSRAAVLSRLKDFYANKIKEGAMC